VTTQRFKLIIAYRGTRYHGWQRQPMLPNYRGEPPPQGQGIPTIQEVLSRTIGEIVGHSIKLVGSSRTDSGVHAKGQVAHFDTTSMQIPAEGMRRAINHALPDDIVVKDIVPVAHGFDAILSTTAKRYQYLLWNSEDRPNFFFDLCWHRWMKLDYDAMKEAATHFVGTHDFASFTKPGHLRDTTVRTVRACELSRRGPRIVVGIEGTGFLWQMVRIIVGTLGDVGLGRIGADEIPRILEARDRRAAGYTAPPGGLFLHWIKTVDEGVAERPTAESLGLALDADHVVLRPLRSNYFPGVLDVLRALGAWFNDESVRTLAREIRFHAGYVAIAGQRVVGFLAFNVMEGAAQIQWMGLAPEYQRKGIGRKLVNKTIDDLKRAGLKEVFVHTLGDSVEYEPYAQTRAFWRTMEFIEHQRIRQENPAWEERLVMRRKLGPGIEATRPAN
jgi:tRNA pseudouridine38-40 synthase